MERVPEQPEIDDKEDGHAEGRADHLGRPPRQHAGADLVKPADIGRAFLRQVHDLKSSRRGPGLHGKRRMSQRLSAGFVPRAGMQKISFGPEAAKETIGSRFWHEVLSEAIGLSVSGSKQHFDATVAASR